MILVQRIGIAQAKYYLMQPWQSLQRLMSSCLAQLEIQLFPVVF
jgi:hypothetical protein